MSQQPHRDSPLMTAPPSPGTPWTWRAGLTVIVAGLTTGACLNQSVLSARGQALIGVVTFLCIALACSTNIRAINWQVRSEMVALM